MTKRKIDRRVFLGATVAAPVIVASARLAVGQAASGKEIDLSGYDLVFEDHFDTLNLNPSPGTDNISPTGWVPEASDGPNPSIEVQRYIDPRVPEMKGVTPFSVSNSILSIEARLTAPEVAGPAVNNRKVTSGLLMTKGWFRQQYGYFEARLKTPKGASGNWPCFWLLSDSGAWPPEIDILEQVNANTTQAVFTIHDAPYPKVGKTQVGEAIRVPDLATDFRRIGVDWQPDGIRYYVDGKQVWEVRPINGVVSIEVTNGGSGYTEPPAVRVTGGGGVNCALRAEVSEGRVSRVLIENSGSGFTSEPRIAIEGKGRSAVARAVVATNDPLVPIDFHTPMYIILNFSLGGPGSWTGETDLSAAGFPRRFEIDYVRAYRKKVAAPAIVQGEQDETRALTRRLEALGAPMPGPQVSRTNDLIRALKSWKLRHDTKPYGVGQTEWDTSALSLWQAMDALYVLATHDGKAALVNWVKPDGPLAEPVGGPRFRAGQGYTFTGKPSEYLETHLKLGEATQFRQRDNHLGVLLSGQLANDDMASPLGVRGSSLLMSRGALLYQLASAPPARGLKIRPVSEGHVVAARGPFNLAVLYHEGAVWQVGAVYGDQAIANGETMKIGANAPAAASISATISAAHWGRRLMPDEVSKLKELLRDYLVV
ncbi:MAG: 1,3,4-beta-glycanase [Hyphomicrobiales bacterium]|nr:1,3,4-beta-glycanase [Hyphomicrobiales bacterium]